MTTEDGTALYFSRSPLGAGLARLKEWAQASSQAGIQALPPDFPVKRHLGLYLFRRDFLLEFTQWPSSALERAEGLEQLRALERGVRIKAGLVTDPALAGRGIDTPEDLEYARRLWQQGAWAKQARRAS